MEKRQNQLSSKRCLAVGCLYLLAGAFFLAVAVFRRGTVDLYLYVVTGSALIVGGIRFLSLYFKKKGQMKK